MKKLYDELSHQVSKSTTEKYSTSFSLGILALHPSIRPAIYAIYGYVRLADEIVDSFHGFDRDGLLRRFKEQTEQALEERISFNPILQSFQDTVHRYGIDRKLIDQFLKSMEMDLCPVNFDEQRYRDYILGSAEVVGLMCLHVFVEGDAKRFESLKPYAMKLGSAFQKVNFLRDLQEDYHILGRTYFPGVDIGLFDDHVKSALEGEIEMELREALTGIRKLPECSRFGVYLAFEYYMSLFKKIRETPARHMLKGRIRISNRRKITLMMTGYVRYKMAIP